MPNYAITHYILDADHPSINKVVDLIDIGQSEAQPRGKAPSRESVESVQNTAAP